MGAKPGRDEKGRFVKGNQYQFYKVQIMVEGKPETVLSQNPHVGKFFKSLKKSK